MSERAQTFTIAKIPADGVGREVVEAGQRVLDCVAGQSGGKLAFAWEEFPWGCEYYDKTGRMMAEDGLEILTGFDAIYFGAVGPTSCPTWARPSRVASAWPRAQTSTRSVASPACSSPCTVPLLTSPAAVSVTRSAPSPAAR